MRFVNVCWASPTICLNRFDLGPEFPQRLLALCQEAGVYPVQAVLERALWDGRASVTIGSLSRAVAHTEGSTGAAAQEGTLEAAPAGGDAGTPNADNAPSVARWRRRPRRIPPGKRSPYIANLIADVSRQFNDLDHLKENDAQAHNLWRASGMDEEDFARLVQEACQVALRLGGARSRMAYFFAVLRVEIIWRHLETCGPCWTYMRSLLCLLPEEERRKWPSLPERPAS